MTKPEIIAFPRAELSQLAPIWFSENTLRFWRTRLPKRAVRAVDGSVWFTTSDRTYDDGRAWSVRVCRPDGNVDTLHPFQGFSSGAEAWAALRARVGLLSPARLRAEVEACAAELAEVEGLAGWETSQRAEALREKLADLSALIP